ncbi:protein kintoun isoform X1 [Trichechus manatus latirostris]|uniref:Protein kintoun n=1 Tax=Trichechus manatus latirostris TaxID=127582 RepID=A0A2Y9QJC3_TRIMA|nr:protein kintoun isoform X1 [Trichechus manatus latirostris]
MAKATASSPLEDLDLSGDEVQRLTSAFQDPEFRRLLSEYAEELTDPENRRRYEAEITALERERGVEVRFVHPEPGHVLRTSLDGARRCFVNVCSNVLVGAPSSRPGSGGAAPGHHWSLPHSLAPGREYAVRQGTRYTVYDVVFHPDALALARRHERFRHMLDATALEAVEKQFGVKLDRRNAKTLKIKYKGTPEAAVLRTPLPGGAPARPEEEPEGPLADFPYPYRYPAASRNSAVPQPQAASSPEPAPPLAPTEPLYRVVQRHHVDLQDYRCSRDSAPSPVPRELVVTIELPLLRSAEQAALEVTGKLLCLDSRKPDYRLRLSLPYPVDDSRGKAQFNKARRQLVITLPVALPAARREPAPAPEGSADPSGTAGAACVSARQGEVGLAGGHAGDEDSSANRGPAAAPEGSADPSETEGAVCAPACQEEAGLAGGHTGDQDSSPSGVGAADVRVATPSAPEAAYSSAGTGEELVPEPEEQDFGGQAGPPLDIREEPPPETGSGYGDSGGCSSCMSSGDLDAGSSAERGGAGRDLSVETRVDWEGTGREPSDGAMVGPRIESGEPLCPPLQCNQDEESLTLLIQVPRILPQSLQGDLKPLRYKLCFSTQDFIYYSFFLQFAPENKLSTKEPVISISSNNVVIELAKSPESHGHWKQWYYGLNNDSLEERLFVSEENVNEFLDEVLSSPFKQTIPLTPPLIEVLQITDNNIQIHAKLQESSNSHELHVKEGVNEGSHLTEKENIEHLITTTTEQEQTLGDARPSDSCVADNALVTDSCGSVAYLKQESRDVFQVLSGKSQQPESKMEPEFIKEKCAVYSNEEKQNLKEPVLTGEKELDGDYLSSLQNKTTVHNISAFESIKETNMQDGSVQIMKDHVTHCAFSFRNSLLYDLD